MGGIAIAILGRNSVTHSSLDKRDLLGSWLVAYLDALQGGSSRPPWLVLRVHRCSGDAVRGARRSVSGVGRHNARENGDVLVSVGRECAQQFRVVFVLVATCGPCV